MTGICAACATQRENVSLNILFCTDTGKILLKFNFSYFGSRVANVKSPISQN